MKKILATAATFSLMSLSLTFLACGDDSSSSSAGPSSGEPGEKVVASIEECNLGSDLVGQEKAYLQGNESEGYRLVIPDMHVNNEWHGDELSVKRNGDTLLVEQEGTLVSLNWVCYSDHWFDIPAADADIKYFKLYNQVFEVVSGPIPERKRTTIIDVNSSSSIVPESSSAVQPGQSSSSVTPPGSSSSVTPPSSSSRPSYNGPVPLKTISATCRERVMTTNPVEPEPPRAYLGISNSFAEIKMFNVDLSYACDSASQKVFWDSLNAGNTVASVIGDTLFVNFKRFDEKGVEYKCGCKADVEFTFDEQYRSFGYTAFENNRPPLELQYILVNRPNLGYQKIEKADAQCNKSGPDDPMVDAALPPVAHMYVNGDSAQIVIEEVVLTCGTIFESVAIEMKDSTLYVTPHYDTSLPQADCLCTSKVSFNIKALDLYKEATLLVYDDGTSFNLSNKMRLIVE
ncbi:MAG: hypothetical protein IJ734_10390 [Fibrobacter sp.]|nr:hypothetical protein [Fibrobacter sp.]